MAPGDRAPVREASAYCAGELPPIVSEVKICDLETRYRGGNAAVRVEVAVARDEALIVCELCAAPGVQQEVGGYLAVRCRACAG